MKPNEAKAVLFLRQYSQHTDLLNEVVETLNFLEDLNKKQDEETKWLWQWKNTWKWWTELDKAYL